MYLVPVIGAATAWLLFGEEFDAQKIGGALLILGGLVLARRGSAPAIEYRPRTDIPASPRPVSP